MILIFAFFGSIFIKNTWANGISSGNSNQPCVLFWRGVVNAEQSEYILNDFVYIQWLVNATKDNEYPPLRLPLGDPSKLRHPMHVSHIRMIVEGSFLPKQSLSPSHLSSFLMQWPLSHWKRSEGHSLDLQLTSSLPSPQSSSWSHRHRSGMHWG